MKKLIFMLASAAVLACGCSRENETAGGEGFGTIRIACDADITIDAATAAAKSQTRAVAKPAGEEFALRITGDGFDRSWESVAAYNAEETAYYFVEGRYTVSVSYGDPEAEGADKPAYTGSTQVDVLPRRNATAAVVARICNSQALVRATESFKKYYRNAEFTLTTGSDNAFTFHPCAGTEEEAVWVKAGTSLTVAGTARGQSQDGIADGPLYTFSPEPLAATRPATRHIFTFDAKQAGSATLTITLGEEYTETRTLDVELNKDAIPD